MDDETIQIAMLTAQMIEHKNREYWLRGHMRGLIFGFALGLIAGAALVVAFILLVVD